MRILTAPNVVTLLRLLMIPVFIVTFYWPFEGHRIVTAGIFLLAAITDWLDGFLARHLNQVSVFGAFLDPVADKLIVTAALILLVCEYANPWIALAGVVIVCREILISALREWMAELGKKSVIKVNMIGKVKTALQMVAILILLSQPVGYTPVVVGGLVLMYVAVALTLWSMVVYMIAAWRVL
jgi:CDP-diacylglycerol--glycerol-3-phosphate 3-phosphatidyltransferase